MDKVKTKDIWVYQRDKDIKCITIGDQVRSMVAMAMMWEGPIKRPKLRLNSLNSKDLKGRGASEKSITPKGAGPDLVIV